MQGKPLKSVIENDSKIHDAVLYGIHGGQVNITDGRYVYSRAPKDKNNLPLYEYTLMPTHMRGFFDLEELKNIEISNDFNFTKDVKLNKIPARKIAGWFEEEVFQTNLYDLKSKEKEDKPINNPEIEKKMIDMLITLMKETDAPIEQYERLGLNN